MPTTVPDYLLRRLRAWDVRHLFAYAGDGINGGCPEVPRVPADPGRAAHPAARATYGQIKDAATALLKGDENRWGVIREGVKAKAREMLPVKGSYPARRARSLAQPAIRAAARLCGPHRGAQHGAHER